MWTTVFWVGALDRAVKSLAQSLLLLWGADAGLDLLSVDLRAALSFGLGAAALSLLTSLLSAPVGDAGSTSLLRGGR